MNMRYVLPLFLAFSISAAHAAPSASDNALKSAIAAGRLQEANNLYRELVSKSPQRVDYRLGYAKFLRSTGQTDQAIQEFAAVLKQKPDQSDALVALAGISLQMLDLENAIGFSESALKFAPANRDAQMIYATACMHSGRSAQAETVLATLLNQGRSHDVLHLAFQIKMRKGDFRQARLYLEDAVAARPDNAQWMLELCQLLESSGDYQTSRNYLQTALDRKPDYTDARIALARNLEVYENNYDAAIEEYEKVLQADPGSPKALAGIDRCRAKKNDLALRLKLKLHSLFSSSK